LLNFIKKLVSINTKKKLVAEKRIYFVDRFEPGGSQKPRRVVNFSVFLEVFYFTFLYQKSKIELVYFNLVISPKNSYITNAVIKNANLTKLKFVDKMDRQKSFW